MLKEHFLELDKIDENVDFYILGLKPNSSRLSVKFIFRKKYADILWNISKFQQELKIVGGLDIVSIHRIYFELTSPEYRMKDDKNNKINPFFNLKCPIINRKPQIHFRIPVLIRSGSVNRQLPDVPVQSRIHTPSRYLTNRTSAGIHADRDLQNDTG